MLEENGVLADSLTFCYKKIEHNKLAWAPLKLKKVGLIKKVKYHPNKDIDVAVIDVRQTMRDYFL